MNERWRQIEDFCSRVGRQFGAERVILFGSQARGEAAADSDVDILVVMPFEGRSANQSVAMRMQLRPPFPVDILVRRPETVQQRLQMGDPFMQQILEEGKVMYESNH